MTERDAIEYGLLLVGRVRDLDPDAVADLLTPMSRHNLYGLAVALAAMVDESRTPSELLGWLDDPFPICQRELWGPKTSRSEHGTRARYNAGCRGDACVQAQRVYDKARYARGKPTRRSTAPECVDQQVVAAVVSAGNFGGNDTAPTDAGTSHGRGGINRDPSGDPAVSSSPTPTHPSSAVA